MPIQLDIEKFYKGEYWTNRYYLNTASIGESADIATEIASVEQSIHLTSITFTKYRLSDMTPGTDNFIVTPLNVQGTGQNDVPLPLFNVLRISLTPLTGRAGIKMYRGALSENDIQDGSLTASSVSFLTPLLNELPLLASGESICDRTGSPYLGVSIHTLVGMRQLRRGTKRRTNPVI